jgi:hypothetical protein
LREKSHFLFLRAWNGLRQIISKFEPWFRSDIDKITLKWCQFYFIEN